MQRRERAAEHLLLVMGGDDEGNHVGIQPRVRSEPGPRGRALSEPAPYARERTRARAPTGERQRAGPLPASASEPAYARERSLRAPPTRSTPAHRDGDRESRQVDGKDTSRIRQVARIDQAIVRFDRPSAEGEAKTQTGAIGAALLERAEQFVDVPSSRPPHSS